MALQTADPPVSPSPQMVANAFVEQYYHILHHSPELVYRFYQDSSVLGRQEENGEMTSVTTMQSINAKILSLDYKSYKAEIKTADAQHSYKDGVIVLVTGCLTGKDNLRRKFAQSFFLAPQTKGYFVLNDVFRYVDESESSDTTAVAIEKVDSGSTLTTVSTEPSHVPYAFAPDMATSIENNQVHCEEPPQAVEKETEAALEEEISAISQSDSQVSLMAESTQMSVKEDDLKNSYASIVRKAKDSTAPTKVHVPANAARSASVSTRKKPTGLMSSTSLAEPAVEKNKKPLEKVSAEQEGFSIYVRNLPTNVMDTQLEQEFKRFGPIKSNGVQVRSNKQQGSCYGFVEFLSASSMENAIQASPIIIGGRKSFVEIKRAITQGDGGRGRFFSGRGGYHNDSFRDHGDYGGGRGSYGSGHGFNGNEFGGRGEYSSRGRGRAARGGEGYHRGRGRAGRGLNRISATA